MAWWRQDLALLLQFYFIYWIDFLYALFSLDFDPTSWRWRQRCSFAPLLHMLPMSSQDSNLFSSSFHSIADNGHYCVSSGHISRPLFQNSNYWWPWVWSNGSLAIDPMYTNDLLWNADWRCDICGVFRGYRRSMVVDLLGKLYLIQ